MNKKLNPLKRGIIAMLLAFVMVLTGVPGAELGIQKVSASGEEELPPPPPEEPGIGEAPPSAEPEQQGINVLDIYWPNPKTGEQFSEWKKEITTPANYSDTKGNENTLHFTYMQCDWEPADTVVQGNTVYTIKNVQIVFVPGSYKLDKNCTVQVNGKIVEASIMNQLVKIPSFTFEKTEADHEHSWTYAAEGGTITATCSNTDGKHKGQLSETLTISTPTDSLAYDGNAKRVILSRTSASEAFNPLPTIEYYKQGSAGKLSSEPTGAGTYTAKITAGETAASVTFTIARTNQPQASIEMDSYTWGQDTLPTPNLSQALLDGGKVTYKYATAEAPDTRMVWNPAFTSEDLVPGEYIMFAEVGATDNYNGCELSKAFTVTAAEFKAGDITAVPYTGFYDGEAHGITVTAPSGSVVTYGTEAGKETSAVNPVYTEAGTHTVFYKVTKVGYKTVTGSADVNIAAKTFRGDENPVQEIAPVTYTGEALEPAVIVKDGDKVLENGKDYTVTYQNNIPAGAAEAVVTLKGNYSGEFTREFTIKKAKASVSIGDIAPKTFGDETFRIAVDKVGESEPVFASTNPKVARVDQDGSVTILGAGETTITVTVPESTNYEAAETEMKLTVAKKNGRMEIEHTELAKTFGDADFNLGSAWGRVSEDLDSAASVTAAIASSNEKVATVDEKTRNVHIVGAGTTTFTITIPATNNYNEVKTTVTLTVAPKTLTKDDVIVTLGDKLIENGETQTQKIVAVKLADGTGIPYTVSGSQAKEAGKYELTVTPVGNYSGKIQVPFVVVAKDDKKIDEVGKIEVLTRGNGSLDTDKSTMVQLVADANELSKVAGGANLKIWLEVNDASETVSRESRELIAAQGGTVGAYLDLRLFKQLAGNDAVQITKVDEPVTISIPVPAELRNIPANTNRTFHIVRVHDGKSETLPTVFHQDSKTLTFQTDRFSDYAIAYKDTRTPGKSVGSKAGANSNTKSGAKSATKSKKKSSAKSKVKSGSRNGAPKTGDAGHWGLWFALMCISATALVMASKKRRYAGKHV